MEYLFDNLKTTHHRFPQAIVVTVYNVVETLFYEEFFLR